MEIEKTLRVSAPRAQVWALLLDPRVMGSAVPGMKSIEVVSPTEYVAVMHQKISFISAKFKLRTRIVEQRAPEYLRAEGTGEDASVASSLKQTSEVFLTATPEGGTELRIKVDVDVLGRLGTFGLSVMKTKADRLWDEFAVNLKARLETGESLDNVPPEAPIIESVRSDDARQLPTPVTTPAAPPEAATVTVSRSHSVSNPETSETVAVFAQAPASTAGPPPRRPWWTRLFGSSSPDPSGGPAESHAGPSIRIEIRQQQRTLIVNWPIEDAVRCNEWLRELVR